VTRRAATGPAAPIVLRQVRAALVETGADGRSILAAVSGGLDSTVLVHGLAALRDELDLDLGVAHVNHGLRGQESDGDERAVEALAAKLGLRFTVEHVTPDELKRGEPSRSRPTTQEAARSLRRDALERVRRELGFDHLATAHHADDQVETVLLRLLRGCGPDGLGGIAEQSRDGVVIRPLLGVSRDALESFAVSAGLEWREDESNEDLRYTRNRLRRTTLPGLARDFNPGLRRAVSNLAEAARRDAEWMDALVGVEARSLFDRRSPTALAIDAEGWRDRPEAMARRLVKRAWIEMGGGRDVSRAHLLRVLRFLREGRDARAGAAIELPGGLRLRRESADSFVLEQATYLRNGRTNDETNETTNQR
jgi:tRNA(Ile)-lysidine synthase